MPRLPWQIKDDLDHLNDIEEIVYGDRRSQPADRNADRLRLEPGSVRHEETASARTDRR